MTDDWATHSEELARKALDTFERATFAYLVDGTLTKKEMRLVVDTLIDTVAGLVPTDVRDTIYEARKEMKLE